MAAQEYNASVTFTATPDAVLAALAKIQENFGKVGVAADESKAKTNKAVEKPEGSEEFISDLAKMAFGFATISGAVNMALEKVVEFTKEMISYIPECIEKTNQLAEQFKGLAVTAGMAVEDFNKFVAVIELSGGKAGDLDTILRGMQRGIRQNSDVLVANGIALDKNALNHMNLEEYIKATVERMEQLGTATEKDQLLMAAFGRGGMQFAAMLVEMNEHMKEAGELSERDGVLTRQSIEDQKALAAAKGRVILAEQEHARIVAESTIGIDIAFQNTKAEAIKYSNEVMEATKLANQGLIDHVYVTNAATGEVTLDYQKMIQAADEYKKSIVGLRQMDAEELTRRKGSTPLAEQIEAQQKLTFITKEELAKRKKDQEDKDKAAEATRQQLNALIDTGNRLMAEDLRLQDATTIAMKEQMSVKEADNKLDDDRSKIKFAVGDSKDPRVLAQANDDRREAEKVHADAITKIHQEAAKERKSVNDSLNEDLERGDEDGLQKRYADIEDFVEKAKKKISDLAQTGVAPEHTDEDIEAMRVHLRAVALKEETRKDLDELKKSLSEESEISGKLSRDQMDQRLNEYAGKGEAQAAAVRQYKVQVHWDETASQGAMSGLKKFFADADNQYTTWQNFAYSTANNIAKQLENVLNDMLTKHKGFFASLKAGWTGLTTSIEQELIKQESKQITNWTLEKMIALWRKMNTSEVISDEGMKSIAASERAATETSAAAKSVAASGTESAAETASVGPKVASATSGFFASFASIPWVGLALALAAIAVMMAVMKSVTAHAEGGVIDHPMLAMMGEGGETEIVANETSFRKWGNETMQMGASIQKAQTASQGAVNSYNRGTVSTGASAVNASANGKGQRPLLIQGNVFASSLDGRRAIVDMLNTADQDRGRIQG